MHCKVRLRCFTVLLLWYAATAAHAQDLAIALAAPLRSLDPHERNEAGHNSVIDHVFETLVGLDARESVRPALAESWKTLDPLNWEFKLRKGVVWHDGSPFTVDDVIASLNRAALRPDSATSFGVFTRRIESVGRVNPHTLRIRTRHPHALLLNDLAAIRIVQARAAASTNPADAALLRIGTGPYRLKEFISGERVLLERHEAHWGLKPPWLRLQLRFITSPQARVFALLAGEVQLAEDMSASDLARLTKEPRAVLASAVTNRLIYLHLDSERESSPFVTAKNGKPLARNPLKDARVRRALSLALDRQAMVDRLFSGRAEPATQLLPAGRAGTSPRIGAPMQDLDGARRLLADAGYPDGFAITLHTPKNRYRQDMQTAHAVAGMLARVGVRVRVEALAADAFFKRLDALEFSFYLAGWSTQTGEASSPLRALIGSFDTRSGMGQANRGRFSDSGVDELIRKAMTTLDEPQRNALLASATDKAIGEQQALIPLHHEMSSWVVRRGFEFSGRSDQATYGFDVRAPMP
jgi:peptide/nickel transport system substrate-binding protein